MGRVTASRYASRVGTEQPSRLQSPPGAPETRRSPSQTSQTLQNSSERKSLERMCLPMCPVVLQLTYSRPGTLFLLFTLISSMVCETFLLRFPITSFYFIISFKPRVQ